jgi:hypothetical protein
MELNLRVVDRMPAQVLITMSVRSLREYIEAYGIDKDMPFVEKTDLINAILTAQITEHNEEVRSLKQAALLMFRYLDRLRPGSEIGIENTSVKVESKVQRTSSQLQIQTAILPPLPMGLTCLSQPPSHLVPKVIAPPMNPLPDRPVILSMGTVRPKRLKLHVHPLT